MGFLPQFALANRQAVEDRIEMLIAILDTLDGDPDLEDATGLEDAFEVHAPDGPGCPLADRSDLAWIEWTSRLPRHRGAAPEPLGNPCAQEDDECSNDAEDGGDAEDDRCADGAGEDRLASDLFEASVA